MNLSHNLLSDSWASHLQKEFKKDYINELSSFLASEKSLGKTIYPCEEEVFSAFNFTPFEKVKVVILGQDPYHGEGQAHGLSFSVKPKIKPPPSLVNIFKEIKNDLDIDRPAHGYLKHWADQGVLLLNSVLTVEDSKAASHQEKGWESFTDKVIEVLNNEGDRLIFLLWGGHAQKKGSSIDSAKHKVLKAPHPSPLSAHRGFLGCKHFSMVNEYLSSIGKETIDWSLPSLMDENN